MDIQTICVCGAGTMGSGIAQVAATAGYNTILYELNEEVLQKAKAIIKKSLQTLVEKNKITSRESAEILSRIRFTSQIENCKAELVIEAIIEKMEAKLSLFTQLMSFNSSEAIFATNTSSLSVSSIANGVSNPSQVSGMHFFNPAPIMKLVEIVQGKKTSNEVIEKLVAITKKMEKTSVVCKDAPGFIVNRVARPYYIESLRLAEEKINNYESIDRLLQSKGFKMGPFKLMDLIGNDVNYAVSCSVYDQLGQPPRLKPSFIQKEKVEERKLGKKTGEGYYKY